jgi:2TM domain
MKRPHNIQRMRAIKDWFTHLSLYLFMVILWSFIANRTGMEWKWVIGMAVIWGMLLAAHAWWVFWYKAPTDDREIMELMQIDE